jgi:uncharacterized membrane protein YgdD (TMEM256/DUF423 family)
MVPKMMRFAALIGAVSGFLAVALGAFAAHGLKNLLSPDVLVIFKTATDYQMFHALALVLVGFIGTQSPGKYATLSALAFILGSLLFCGSLYILAFGFPNIIGIITPIGGCLLLLGWLCLAIHLWPQNQSNSTL